MAEIITVKVIASFDGMRLGDVVQVELTPRIKGIIACGLLKDVSNDGASTGGPDGDPAGSEASGAAGGFGGDAANAEQSAHFGAGGYGQA